MCSSPFSLRLEKKEKNGPLPPPTGTHPIYRKLKIVSDLFEMAYRIKSHQYKKKYPLASEEDIKKMTLAAIEKGCR